MQRKLNSFFAVLVLMLGPVLAVAAPPQRIVSLAPNLTEILYGVGAFNRVVAVSDYCTFPPSVKSLPRVGGWSSPNLERIVALRPDLIVMTDAQAGVFGSRVQKLGIRMLVTPSQTVNDVFSAINIVGTAVGRQKQAQLLANQTMATMNQVRNRMRNVNRPRVLLVVDRSPGTLRDLYGAGQGSYLGDLVEMAGGRVVVPRSRAGYSNLSKESLLVMNADVILELRPGANAQELTRARGEWQQLAALNAVRNGRVYELSQDFLPHNSQMVAQTVLLLARILHPEIPARELGAKQ